MKIKQLSFLILSFIMLLTGCVNSETGVETKIYETFFKRIVKVGIPKILPQNIAIISGDEIEILKKEMKDIGNIKEYTRDAAIGTNFIDDFRLLYIHTEQTLKENKFLGLLYSTKENAMIVRKYDIDSNFRERFPNLTVYEFKMPGKVSQLLKKYEKKLPEDGYFYNSWPRIHY